MVSKSVSFEVDGHYGFFIANQPKSLYLRDDHARFIELSITRETTGKYDWERFNNLPGIGASILYGSVGSSYLGKMLTVFPYIHFPLLRRSRTLTTFRLGAGIGWVEKPFDKNTNYKNLMIGSHINAAINMKLQSEWQITKGIYANIAIGFSHLSNGAVRLPNLGLNLPTFSAGLIYKGGVPQQVTTRQRLPRLRKTNFYLQAAVAFKETYPLENKAYLVEILSGELRRTLTPVSSINAGITIAYDRSLSKEITFVQAYGFDKSALQVQASIYAGYEHHVGRLSFPVQLGTYLYNNYAAKSLYQLIGTRYRISQKWIAAVQLKAHFGKADYIQYALAYKIF